MSELIRTGLEEYALRSDPGRPGWGLPAQRHLPFDGTGRHIPLGAFPVSPLELSRVFFRNAGLRSMNATRLTCTDEIILSYAACEADGRGVRRPIIYVRPEHIDEDDFDELTGGARFAALRELARLLSSKLSPRGPRQPFWPSEVTVEIHAGNYLAEGFFDDPLNRWAMEMGCPPAELRLLLREQWSAIPVTAKRVERQRPILASQEHAREQLFLERRYHGRGLDEIFGLNDHAVLAWCRRKGFITW